MISHILFIHTPGNSVEVKHPCLSEMKFICLTLLIISGATDSRSVVVGRPPVITVDGFDRSGGLHLQCESEGWYPEPDLEWLDSEGVSLSSETAETHRNTDRFSLKQAVIVYHSGKIHCRVKLRHHMLETLINTTSSMFNLWRTAAILFSVIVVLSGFAGILFTVFLHKYREHNQLQTENRRIKHGQFCIEWFFASTSCIKIICRLIWIIPSLIMNSALVCKTIITHCLFIYELNEIDLILWQRYT
ncbi:butyrophilin-like protein 3 [Rhinichthys klamathensis goyatoka]|uniref:butyrophilin-like protein 3 n=1 Tax=Rhinichthys klamathensis goyatoka TaxID=3034132 RepID=UPI0024B5ABB7|nr:butyrophilin-like protein 3 [Rhinichthys klamathensis goyatoka]